MIAAAELVGIDEDLASRVIAHARTIAPIDTLPESGSVRAAAVALLKGVALEAALRGSPLVTSQRTGPASASYGAASWFSDDDRAALRALCGVTTSGGAPVGRFPLPGRTVTGMWPEQYEGDLL